MSQKFSPGDIVQLKSGGPAMTIRKFSEFGEPSYTCEWFKGATKQRGDFEEATLKVYEPPQND